MAEEGAKVDKAAIVDGVCPVDERDMLYGIEANGLKEEMRLAHECGEQELLELLEELERNPKKLEALRAKIKAEDNAPKTTTCCERCNACCCRAFNFYVPVKLIKDDIWEVDWDKQREKFPKMTEFVDTMEKYWVPIRQPRGQDDWVEVRMGLGCGDWHADIWFGCKALVDGKCSIYEDRPYACLKYVCDCAERYNMTPEEAVKAGHDPVNKWPGLFQVYGLYEPLRGRTYDSDEAVVQGKIRRAYDRGVEQGFAIHQDGQYTGKTPFEYEELHRVPDEEKAAED